MTTTLMLSWMLIGAFYATALCGLAALFLGRKRVVVGVCVLLTVELLVRVAGARAWGWPTDPRRVVDAQEVKLMADLRDWQGEVELLRGRLEAVERNRNVLIERVALMKEKIEGAERTRAGWAREAAGAREALDRALQQATGEMNKQGSEVRGQGSGGDR
jgi:hypothetical protein